MLPQAVFVQNSVHLAGAQKSLSRLLSAPGMQEHDPVLLTGKEGWLTQHCTAHNVRWVRLPFPASRSLAGRLWENWAFARRAAKALCPLLTPGRPVIVHTNDHPDSLLGLALARELKAIPVLTLRTPGMSQRDFEKYRCGDHKHIIAVGDDLFQKVHPWVSGQRPLTLVHNGVTAEEVLPPREGASVQPLERILVLGSIIPRKGWQDLVETLLLLESRLPQGPVPEIHFLGDLLGQEAAAVLEAGRLKRFRVSFLGVVENYRERLREYALAVHPSRSESFGMAALECVAAGVPLLAASSGVIPEFIPREAFLFPPQQPAVLADKLEALLKMDGAQISAAFAFEEAQAVIRDRFATPGTVRKLHNIYTGLMPDRA
ncbi:glycosyltransferase family 4 protein [Prosthecobacter sp. SYSU 5D2]|uniref:glycosyltransferase family 4 protein n=1 Tax=Prosthecobacter sp. SYSU 5D2 TaxID=3134134 RepID=UPI0031FEFB7C